MLLINDSSVPYTTNYRNCGFIPIKFARAAAVAIPAEMIIIVSIFFSPSSIDIYYHDIRSHRSYINLS